MDYGDIIYRHAATTTLKPLDSIHHFALRFITGDRYDTHHCILSKNAGWSSLSDRRMKHWYMFIFKALTGKQPPYFSSLLEWRSGSYSTRSSGLMFLKDPFVHSELGESAFSFDAPNSWNILQHALGLENIPSLADFKYMVSDFCKSPCDCFSM